MTALTIFMLLAALAALAAAWWAPYRNRRRQHAVKRLLDAADALESRLRTARTEIETVTGNDDGVRTALQEMLRQRLWLQQHGDDASLKQLNEIRHSIDAARQRIDQQLELIERARANHP